MADISGIRKALSRNITDPLVRALAKTPVTPDSLTWTGFLLTLGAAALIILDQLVAAGALVIFAGLFDMLDGALARYQNRTTTFGAALDSTLDRVSEAALFIGLMVLFTRLPSAGLVALAGTTLAASFLVSYIRARAEALGLRCQSGVFTRPERVIVLAAGLLLGGISHALTIALAVILAFSLVTITQRLGQVKKQT